MTFSVQSTDVADVTRLYGIGKRDLLKRTRSHIWSNPIYSFRCKNYRIYVLEKLMVLLRDGRTLIGYLRSVDQFANLVLHKTIERIHVGTEYGDIPRGIFIIRGENVVLLGEIVREHCEYLGGN